MQSLAIPSTLLAKSRIDGRELSLEQHSSDTEYAASTIFDPATRVGRNFWKAFRISESSEQCYLNLRVAALFHDIGKCNEDFYAAVTHANRDGQSIRHEHLSALILHLPEVTAWLSGGSAVDIDLVTAAVLSHHLKADEVLFCNPPTGSGSKSRIRIFLEHPEIRRILLQVAGLASLCEPPSLLYSVLDLSAPPWCDSYDSIRQLAKDAIRRVRRDEVRGNSFAAVKAALIVADSVSSGVVRHGMSLSSWIQSNVHLDELTADDLEGEILSPRADQIRRLKGNFSYHNFQELICTRGDRVLLRAGCGAGKTLAAYKWAKQRLLHHRVGRLIFLYPTRGTATEGFRDYLGWAPEGTAELRHGSAQYELESILSNPPESLEGKNLALIEDKDRWFALNAFRRRYFSATVDQFLGFMEHNYSSMCMLPLLSDSLVVIDEIHSFDEHLFKNLLSFLERMDIPTLCMTATLQNERIVSIDGLQRKLESYPSVTDEVHLQDLKVDESHPRYLISRSAKDDCLDFVSTAVVERHERVLWVANTVARCQQIAKELAARVGLENVIVYHSRFRLKDRQEKHQSCVSKLGFGSKALGVVAVTTQVCEMSLDLDADSLISETAPIESLIQRFGRVNRHYKDRPTRKGTIFVYSAASNLPYDRTDLQAGDEFVDALSRLPVDQQNQSALASEMLRLSPEGRRTDPRGRIFESGIYAVPGSIRDIDEFCSGAVLEDDLSDVRHAIQNGRSHEGFVVPVPVSFKQICESPSWLPRHLKVVRNQNYDSHFGFMEQVEAQT